MKKATALPPVEPIAAGPFRGRGSRATTEPNAKEARSSRATAEPGVSSKRTALQERRESCGTTEPRAKAARSARAAAEPEAESRKRRRVERRHGIVASRIFILDILATGEFRSSANHSSTFPGQL